MTAKSCAATVLVLAGGLLLVGCTQKPKETTRILDKVHHHHLGGYMAAAPLVEGDHLYTATGMGGMHKLDAATGATLWSLPRVFKGYCNITPVLAGRMVIAVDSNLMVAALDKETGKKLWVLSKKPTQIGEEAKKEKKKPVDHVQKFWPDDAADLRCRGCFAASPTGDLVILGGHDGRIFALDPASGDVRWRSELYPGSELVAPPAFAGDKVVLVTLTGRAWALRLADGTPCWELPKVLAWGASGKQVEVEKEGKKEIAFHLTVEFKYNFHEEDHFATGKDGGKPLFTLHLLDGAGRPLSFKGEGEESDNTIPIKRLEPGEHLKAESQVKGETVELLSPPNPIKGFPIQVVIKDGAGKEIHRGGFEVDFPAPRKKEEGTL